MCRHDSDALHLSRRSNPSRCMRPWHASRDRPGAVYYDHRKARTPTTSLHPETTARAERIVTHSLPGGFIFAILLSCWEELGGMGNTGDTGKAQWEEHRFTRSPG